MYLNDECLVKVCQLPMNDETGEIALDNDIETASLKNNDSSNAKFNLHINFNMNGMITQLEDHLMGGPFIKTHSIKSMLTQKQN